MLLPLTAVSYSLYTKSLSGHDTKVVAGDIYMRYANGATKEISMVPSNTYNEGDYYEFSINGKNTSDKDIVYDIVLNHGENYNDPYVRLNDKYYLNDIGQTISDGVPVQHYLYSGPYWDWLKSVFK